MFIFLFLIFSTAVFSGPIFSGEPPIPFITVTEPEEGTHQAESSLPDFISAESLASLIDQLSQAHL